MHRGLAEFVRPLAQAIVQELECPHGVFLGINTGGHLADVLGDVGVPRETVDELGAGSKEPFAHGTKAWLSGWPSFLGAFKAREQRLEVDAFDLLAAFDDQDLREPPMAANAFPQDHHARPIGWRIETQVEGEHTPRKCAEENRQPRTAEVGRGSGPCWSKGSPRPARY